MLMNTIISVSIRSLLLLLLGSLMTPAALAQEPAGPGKGRITGQVTDGGSGQPLIGVNIIIKKDDETGDRPLGSTSDLDGAFHLDELPAGIYALQFSYVGYEALIRTDIVVRPGRSTRLQVSLQESVFTSEELVITAGYFENRSDQPVSSVQFNPEEIRRAPGGGQEVLRIVNMLPSVASVGDTRQDILVRGGSPLENGFYVDNIPMPGIQHFRQQGGRTSGPIGIINTDLVSELDFRGGGFGPSYGGAMSSVTDISYREGSREGFQGDVNFNMAGAGGTLEHGLARGKGSVLLSARRSYLDLLAAAIDAGGAPRYSDAQLKSVYEPNSRQRLSLLNIYGSSHFSSEAGEALDEGLDSSFDTGNWQNTLGLNLRTLWSKSGNVYTNTSVSWSVREDDTRSFDILRQPNGQPVEEPSFTLDIREQFWALRSVSFARLTQNIGLEFGTDLRYEHQDYEYFIAGGFDRAGQPRPDFERDTQLSGLLAAGFASLQLRPEFMRRLSLNTGLRLGYSGYNGNTQLSPRISARYALSTKLSANAAWGIFHQPNPRFLLSQSAQNKALKNPRATHYIAGLEYLLRPETLVSLEVYHKAYRRMPEPANPPPGADPGWIFDNAGAYNPALYAEAEGWARGAELLLQKKMADGFYGSVSASYFRSGYDDFAGISRDRDFDIRYLFAINGGYRPNDSWEFSARWSWQGGPPRTPFDRNASLERGRGVLDISRFNKERMPAFHALYVRFDRRFFYSRSNIVTFLEVWNAYNRSNVDSYAWNSVDGEQTTINQFSVLPVGGVSFEF